MLIKKEQFALYPYKNERQVLVMDNENVNNESMNQERKSRESIEQVNMSPVSENHDNESVINLSQISEKNDNAEPENEKLESMKSDTVPHAYSSNMGNPYQSSNTYGQGIYTGNDFSNSYTEQKEKKKKKQKAKKPGSGKAKKVFGFIATAAAFGLIAGGVMVGVNALGNKALGNKNSKAVTEVATVQATDKGVKEKTENDSVADVAEEVMPSIVSITNKSVQVVRSWFQSYEQEVQGAGSGIIIGQTDDEILVATNNHVIDGAKELTVTFCDQESVAAEVKDADEGMDLAVIAVKVSDMKQDTLKKIKVAALGSSDDLRVGERAIAIGNALGYGQSVTAGFISALDREVSAEGATHRMIQTDAAINPGNSGGALLNSKGEVIGINTIKYADTQVEGMGYAIPISKAIPIINDMMNMKVIKEAEQGYLGIEGRTITDEYVEGFNMPRGVYVTKLIDDSPADKAGLKSGDVIIKAGDRDVATMEELQSILSKRQAGEELVLTVKRNDGRGEYKEETIKLTLGAKKDMPKNSKAKKDDKADSDKKDKVPDDNGEEPDSDANDENGNGYNGNDNNGQYREVDPDEFFRDFDEFFNY